MRGCHKPTQPPNLAARAVGDVRRADAYAGNKATLASCDPVSVTPLGRPAVFKLLCLAIVVLSEFEQAAAKFSIEYFTRKLAKS